MISTKVRFFLILILLISSALYAADLPREGIELYRRGEIRRAERIFAAWLREHPDDEGFDTVLGYYIDSIRNIDDALRFLDELKGAVSVRDNVNSLLSSRGFLLELRGNVSEAQQAFELAGMSSAQREGIENFFHSIQLLIEMGELSRAEAQTMAIISTADDKELKNRGSLYYAYIQYIQGREEKGRQFLETVHPQLEELSLRDLYLFYTCAVLYDIDQYIEAAESLISEQYGESIEYTELRQKGLVVIEPSLHYFEALAQRLKEDAAVSEDDDPVRIQAGIFSKRDNAEYLVQRLTEDGFSLGISAIERENGTLFRVVTPSMRMEQSQDNIIRLKEKGYEGFLLFP